MLALRKTPAVQLGLAGRSLYLVPNPRRGLGAMVVHGVTEEDCTVLPFQSQFDCVQRNMAAVEQSYAEHPGSYLGGGVYANTPQAAAIYGPGGANSYTTPGSVYYNAPAVTAAVAPPPVVYRPSVAFSTSRGGSTAYPGDTWRVSISGGAPNSPVSVTGGKGGAMDTNSMGSTDSSGNYSKAGTFGAGEVGSWYEAWQVGGAPAGSFSFVVSAPAAAPPPGGGAGSGGSGGGGQTAGSTVAGGGNTAGASPNTSGHDMSFGPLDFLTGSAFLGVPNLVWVVGAGLLLFRGRGR